MKAAARRAKVRRTTMAINVTGSGWRGATPGTASNDYFFMDQAGQRKLGLGGHDTMEAGAGEDWFDGGANVDTIHYGASTAGVRVDLRNEVQSGGYAEGDHLLGVENVIGSRHDDTITGNGEKNTLDGGRGADVLDGGANDDFLKGGLDGRTDTLIGGSGFDTVDYMDATQAMTITLGDNGQAGTGVVNAHTVQTFINGYSALMFVPAVTEDRLFSIERVWAGSGDDTIIGNSQDNQLFGGEGRDTIVGGGGVDGLYGGGGADTFVFRDGDLVANAPDRIMDFDRGFDRIDLSAMDANTSLTGNQAFRIVAAFTGRAGELVIGDPIPGSIVGAEEVISMDTNGDRVADWMISVYRAPYDSSLLSAGDFIL
jgi:Ca2+-binding RTX toxin-like protein